jgi:hypothetical protein
VTKRLRRLLILLAVVVPQGVLTLPGVHWPVIGWARGEPFYRARPASYWASELRHARFGEGTESVMRSSVCRPAGPFPRFLELLGCPIELEDMPRDRLPYTRGDSAAIAVLTHLLDHGDPYVQFMAVWGLKEAGPPAWPAIPKLVRLADRSAWREGMLAVSLADLARQALRHIDPETWDTYNGCRGQ